MTVRKGEKKYVDKRVIQFIINYSVVLIFELCKYVIFHLYGLFSGSIIKL